MKLYTTTGDDGHTSLVDGSRVSKDDSRVAAAGNVDALNSLLGWCRAAPGADGLAPMIELIQNELFHLGAELATPTESREILRIALLGAEQIHRLENWIDEATAAVPPLIHFVLPGGVELACRLHIARTSCRVLERAVVTMANTFQTRSEVLVYINRLGDLLFAWARQANHEANLPDPIWDQKK
ncbi:MAG: cob(I)yrinic acid a,c-diamide adenosyltransferase [Phycisphaerales bacterium]|nr:cob(I)yrinic acid a,c-diamide adenosyltransferase [Phycisphaerales bacterium]